MHRKNCWVLLVVVTAIVNGRIAYSQAGSGSSAPGAVRENPRWPQGTSGFRQGTFVMGCEPGDTECRVMTRNRHTR